MPVEDQRTADPQSEPTRRGARRPFDPCVIVVVLLWAAMAPTARYAWRTPGPDVAPPKILSSINPNTALWWELAVLPRIGESKARRIVDYRQLGSPFQKDDPRSIAFARPADLARVSGIGPKTVKRIHHYLRFD